MSKQFGLIVPDKSKKTVKKPINVFGDSSSDDERAPKRKVINTDLSVTQKKLAEKVKSDALAEDPSIFQYDEVYEEIENKRKEEKLAKKTQEARAPKYIAKLLETAEKRKKENERRVERQVQKEREAEGEQFKDKESFVTSSYRKKLEEMKAAEEAEKREEYLENIGDVTKQQDLSGFYRHIYEQKLAPDQAKEKAEKFVDKIEKKPAEHAKKNYRKRKSSGDMEKDESDKDEAAAAVGDAAKKAHLQSNLDADSDFSIDSSDSEDEKQTKAKIPKNEESKTESEPAPPGVDPPGENGENLPVDKIKTEPKDEEVEEVAKEEPKPKIDIWKKRTVGAVFDDALQRYYQRKAEREAAA